MRPIGHLGGALALTAIVMWSLDVSDVPWFTAVVVPASLLPDIDRTFPYVYHQGVVHTYPVMLLVSVAVGLVAAAVAVVSLPPDRASRASERMITSAGEAFVLTTGAMLLGTFSHVTLDLVAYRETFTRPPVEPLWPFTDWVPRINVFPPEATVWNYGFLVLGVALWLVVFEVKRPRET